MNLQVSRVPGPNTNTPSLDRAKGPPSISSQQKPSFLEIFNAKGDAFPELIALQERVLSGKSMSPRELLYFQVRAGNFNLQIELIFYPYKPLQGILLLHGPSGSLKISSL